MLKKKNKLNNRKTQRTRNNPVNKNLQKEEKMNLYANQTQPRWIFVEEKTRIEKEKEKENAGEYLRVF